MLFCKMEKAKKKSNLFLWSIVFMCAISFSNLLLSQDTGVVKFQIDNDNGYFEVLINDTLLVKKYAETLPVGSYKAQVWSYGYDVADFEFKVDKDKVTETYVKLERSTPYGAYQEAYKNYRLKFHKSITLPITSTLVVGLTSGFIMLKGYDLRKKITSDINDYSITSNSAEIDALKLRVEENNRKYNRLRTGFYISSGFAVLGIATSIYTSIRFKRNNQEPTYSKQSPFMNKVGLGFSADGCTITLRL